MSMETKSYARLFMESYIELLILTQQKIEENLRKKQRSTAWLASKLNLDPSNFAKKLKNHDIQDKMLAEICCILDENFFLHHYNFIENKINGKN